MDILSIFRSKNTPTETKIEERSYYDDMGIALNFSQFGSNFKVSSSMTLSAVYRAEECISNTIASLPVKLYQKDKNGYKTIVNSPLSYALAKQPNQKMNSFTFYKLLVKDILMTGNAYAIIKRENGVPVGLDYISSGYVSPIDKIDHIEYQITNYKKTVKAEDICHFMNYSDNGVYGISVLTHARRTLGIADYGDKAAENFFKSGGSKSGFLKFTGPSNGKQKEEILQAWNNSQNSYGGVNGIAVLPSNVDFTQLSISPADAQLLESRKFSVIEIARFFSVPPSKLFDTEKSSYASEEINNIMFLNETIRPLIVKMEIELERKLFPNSTEYDIKFDVSEMLRTDKASQASYFTSLFNLGAITSNEIRKELDYAPVEGGDEALVQVNLAKLKNIGNYNNGDQDNRLKEDNNTEEE